MDKIKYEPHRKCVVCGKITNKSELIRIVKNKDNEIKVDYKNNCDGRGLYICNNNECVSLLIKKGGLNRGFRKKIPAETQNRIFLELTEI